MTGGVFRRLPQARTRQRYDGAGLEIQTLNVGCSAAVKKRVAGRVAGCEVFVPRFFLERMPFFLRPRKTECVPSGGFRIPPEGYVLRVGSDQGNEVRLVDGSVSSLHARIEANGGGCFEVVDCGSSNGTFVNGERVLRHPLAAGDLVRFASVEFEVAGAEEGRVRDERNELCDSSGSPGVPGAVGEAAPATAMQRTSDDAARREEDLVAALSEARAEILDRDGAIAALRYEFGVLEGRAEQLERDRCAAEDRGKTLETECASLREALSAAEAARKEASAAREAAESRERSLLSRACTFGSRLLEDWKAWRDEIEERSLPSESDEEEIFGVLEAVASQIRSELDRIEPVWFESGDRVREELEARCEQRRVECGKVERDVAWHLRELEHLKSELSVFRSLLESEVRRAQGLSRRGVEVEIPRRFEEMVRPGRREVALCLALLGGCEAVDALLESRDRGSGRRELERRLREIRAEFLAALEAAGAKPFEVEVGTRLGPQHRSEVELLVCKGWGRRGHASVPFRPGEVVEVVRPGYRLGSGEGSPLLRKAGVVARGTEPS